MAYIGSSPTKVVSRQSANIFSYTATANQTAFTGADANGNTLACSPSDIMVHMNGLRLEESDYTASTTTVTLGSGAAAGDEVTITAFVTFESADHYTKSVADARYYTQTVADTRYVNTSGDTMTGTLNVNGGNIYLAEDDAAAHRYMFLNTGASQDGHIVLQRGLANKYQVTAKTDNSYSIYSYPVSGQVFNIDSSGRVTTPYNPYFWAQAANVGASDYSGGPTIFIGGGVNSTTVSDIGGHYSTSTGRFTAPVSGVYHFSAVVRIDSFGGSYSYLTLWDSGSVAFVRDLTSITETYYSHTVAASRYLSANDYVYCTLVTAGDTSVTISSDSYFSGHLVG